MANLMALHIERRAHSVRRPLGVLLECLPTDRLLENTVTVGIRRLSLDQATHLNGRVVLGGRSREKRRNRGDHAADLSAENADRDHGSQRQASKEKAVLSERSSPLPSIVDLCSS